MLTKHNGERSMKFHQLLKLKINQTLLMLTGIATIPYLSAMESPASHANGNIAIQKQTDDLYRLLRNTQSSNRSNNTKLDHLLKKEVVALLAHGANLEQKDRYGNTALIIAAILDNFTLMRLFIKQKASLDAQNINGDTALIIAAANGNKNMVRLLLRNNANINVQNNSGNTALIIATAGGEIDIIRLLLENGAVKNITNKSGKNALAIAQEKGKKEIIDLLKNPPLLKFIGKKQKLI